MGNSNLRQSRTANLFGKILSNEVFGFLALLTLFLAFIPDIFDLSAQSQGLLEYIEFLILIIFVIEYCISFANSTDKKAFLINPWRILDALIILLGLLSLTPILNDMFRNTPALRLFRFFRLALFGTKSSSVIVSKSKPAIMANAISDQSMETLSLKYGQNAQFQKISFDAAIEDILSPQDTLILISNPEKGVLQQVATSLEVSETMLRNRFYASHFPRIERMENYTTLFLWYPVIQDDEISGVPTIARTGVLFVGSKNNLVILTQSKTELPLSIVSQLNEKDSDQLAFKSTLALLKNLNQSYTQINDQLETSLFRIESQHHNFDDKTFLSLTFKLRGELSRVRSSLKHLGNVLKQLAEKPVAIKSFPTEPRPEFSILAEDTESLHESIDYLLSTLSALVDLRLNVSSFQLNKVMRLLALLTALALIPTVTGGLLGMNLMESPWPISLSQVSFGIAVGMILCLYLFAVKGWLK